MYFSDDGEGAPSKEKGVCLTGKDGRFAEFQPNDPNIDAAMFPLLLPFGQTTYRWDEMKKVLGEGDEHLDDAEAESEGSGGEDEDGEVLASVSCWRVFFIFHFALLLTFLFSETEGEASPRVDAPILSIRVADPDKGLGWLPLALVGPDVGAGVRADGVQPYPSDRSGCTKERAAKLGCVLA